MSPNATNAKTFRDEGFIIAPMSTGAPEWTCISRLTGVLKRADVLKRAA
jgi:hypothetical protein